jgi:hypothetical protein
MLVLGTLLPVVVAAAIVALVVTHRSHSSGDAATRSPTAFASCMKDQGAETPSVRANVRLLRLAAAACKSHLPKGMPLPDFTIPAEPAQGAREAYQQCVRSALAGLSGGGRFSRPSQKEFENAVALCRHLSPGAPGQGRATT